MCADSPRRAFEGELAVQPPFDFWGLPGYSADCGAKAFRRRREAELKHGRVSMISPTLPTLGWVQMFLLCGMISNLEPDASA